MSEALELLICNGRDDLSRLSGHYWHCPDCDMHLTSLGLCPQCGIRYEFQENAPSVLLRYIDVLQILDKELRWCLDNPDPAFHAEYRKGFMNGLIQAKYLVTQITQLME